jgi:L-alanine-DL-glutamate epimerase-like enolase superfamily enzyme
MTAIRNISCKTVVRPLRTTFATARGAKTVATSIVITVTCDDGCVGFGEVPTSFVVPQETPKNIKRHIRRAAKWLRGNHIEQWPALTARFRDIIPDFHMTCSGIETAMFRAYLASTGLDEQSWWGNRKTTTVKTDITVPFAADSEILRPWIQQAIGKKFDTYKIKVSGDISTDVKFVHAVAQMLDATDRPYTLRLDGNQGFTYSSALHLIERVKVPIELFEQPLKFNSYHEMEKLHHESPVPIIADETVFTVNDARHVIDRGLAHGINIKIAKSGITQSCEIIKLAKQAKLRLMIGCMTETMVGLSAAIYCAAGTDAFDYFDLDGVHFLYARNRYRNITINGPIYWLGENA